MDINNNNIINDIARQLASSGNGHIDDNNDNDNNNNLIPSGADRCLMVGRTFLDDLMQFNAIFEEIILVQLLVELQFTLHYMYYSVMSADLHQRVNNLTRRKDGNGLNRLPASAKSSFDQFVRNERQFLDSLPMVFGNTLQSLGMSAYKMIKHIYAANPSKHYIFHPKNQTLLTDALPLKEVATKLQGLLVNNLTLAVKVAQGLHYALQCTRASDLDDNTKMAEYFITAGYNSQLNLIITSRMEEVAMAAAAAAAATASSSSSRPGAAISIKMNLSPLPILFVWPLINYAYKQALSEVSAITSMPSFVVACSRNMMLGLLELIPKNDYTPFLLGKVWPPEILRYKSAASYPVHYREDVSANCVLLGPRLAAEFMQFSPAPEQAFNQNSFLSLFNLLSTKLDAINAKKEDREGVGIDARKETIKSLMAQPSLSFRSDIDVNATLECVSAYQALITRDAERRKTYVKPLLQQQQLTAQSLSSLTDALAQLDSMDYVNSSSINNTNASNNEEDGNDGLPSLMNIATAAATVASLTLPSPSPPTAATTTLAPSVSAEEPPIASQKAITSPQPQTQTSPIATAEAPISTAATTTTSSPAVDTDPSPFEKAGVSIIAYNNATQRLRLALDLVNSFNAKLGNSQWIVQAPKAKASSASKSKEGGNALPSTTTTNATATVDIAAPASATKKRKRVEKTKQIKSAENGGGGGIDEVKPKKKRAKKTASVTTSTQPETSSQPSSTLVK
jgi:hypothetical protein